MILEKLLETQEAYGGDPLISNDEIDLIKAIWAQDLSKKSQ